MVLKLSGRKPVIYLFPPTTLTSIDVTLSLVPDWSSALYPVSEIFPTKTGGTSTSLRVSDAPDGTLVDLETNTSLAYLFWEAHTNSLPPSPPLLPIELTSPPASLTPPFIPSQASLTPSNSVLLPFATFLPALDKALPSLTLHTSARNDFITYWLPSFIKIRDRGEKIAFRFVEQAAYEQAARLDVEPRPDVVTRVFMLFLGVGEEEELGDEWMSGEREEVDWRKVVGVDEGATDPAKFRVLEWGGMEVLRGLCCFVKHLLLLCLSLGLD